MDTPRRPPQEQAEERVIILLRPTLALREAVYRWMTAPGIIEKMMGPPLFPELPVPSFQEFCTDWEPHHWTHDQPERGRMFLAAADGELVGCVVQNDVVVTGSGSRAAELDLWLAGPKFVGKRYGRRMILALCDRIKQELAVEEAFLQPSSRNAIAMRAYAGAGFRRSPLTATEAATHYRTQPDYRDSVFFVKRLDG